MLFSSIPYALAHVLPSKSTISPYLSRSTPNAISYAHKMLAFRALRQGLKFSYENWRMWANYMMVAVDVGELAEATRAMTRVVEQRAEKDGAACVDEDVLGRLVDAVTRADPPSYDTDTDINNVRNTATNSNAGYGLLPRVLDLLERTLLPRVSSPRIFRAYARVLTWQGNRWADVLKAHLDAYRVGPAGQMSSTGTGTGTAPNALTTDVVRWRGAVGEVEEVVDVLRNFGPRVEGSRWLFQARSIVRSFMGRTKDFEEEEEWGRLVGLQEELRQEGA